LEKERGKTNGLSDEELRRKLDETNKRITFIRGEIEALLKQIKPLTPYYRDPGR